MTNYPACFYRVSAKGVISIDDKLVLAQEGNTKRWDLPGGGIEHFEEIEAAFNREILEELGVDVSRLHSEQVWPWITYDQDPGWEKPVLYLVYRAELTSQPVESKLGKGIKVGYFSKEDVLSLPLEKHVEKFRDKLIEIAFGGS